MDWRNGGYVSPVKNEGTCSASWSFSSIASIESKFKIDNIEGKFAAESLPATDSNGFLIFSEQELIDCDNQPFTCKNNATLKSLGCTGGYECTALGYYKYRNLTLEANYPFTGADNQTCTFG